MKYFRILTIVLLSSVMSFYSCNYKTDASKDEASESLEISNMPNSPDGMTAEPAQNAEGIWHYTCNKGCAGGAGAAGTCAVCGGPLEHNAAYHGNANPTNTANPTMNPTAAPAPEPAQNAAGVWHYTCEKGCAGGAGAAGICAVCGGNLMHNAVYHQ